MSMVAELKDKIVELQGKYNIKVSQSQALSNRVSREGLATTMDVFDKMHELTMEQLRLEHELNLAHEQLCYTHNLNQLNGISDDIPNIGMN
jgi:predicted nuclease with TOPRIM domain